MRRDAMRCAVLLVLLLVAGCGRGGEPLRIGVIVDCEGINRQLGGAETAAAALPLVARGARVGGPPGAGGIGAARVAGRDVELVRGCTEIYELATFTNEVRRLVENERVDALVAGVGGPDQIILRDLARRYPGVPVVLAGPGPRAATGRRPAANLFRFSADHGQAAAGLAERAYQDLGWRRVAVVAANWDVGWDGRAAFAATFCELGGDVAANLAPDRFDPRGSEVAEIPADVDGVAVFANAFFGPEAFLRRLARTMRDPAARVLLGAGIADDEGLLRSTGDALDGAGAVSLIDPAARSRYLQAFAEAFPAVPRDVAATSAVAGYHDAMEALLSALEAAQGHRDRLPVELSQLEVHLTAGTVRLGPRRQAVLDARLVRVEDGARLRQLELVGDVDTTLGGRLPVSRASTSVPPACGPSPRSSR
jgi:branched-chain amino acid transport system substrate-binding protein